MYHLLKNNNTFVTIYTQYGTSTMLPHSIFFFFVIGLGKFFENVSYVSEYMVDYIFESNFF